MCIYIHIGKERERDIYMYIYIYIHTHTYTSTYVCIYVYVCIAPFLSWPPAMNVTPPAWPDGLLSCRIITYTNSYTYIYIYIYIHVYVYIYIYREREIDIHNTYMYNVYTVLSCRMLAQDEGGPSKGGFPINLVYFIYGYIFV